MNSGNWKVKRISMAMVAIMVFATLTEGQQTVFNVPSADPTPTGSVYLEHETQFRFWKPGRYWHGTDYFAYGLSNGTEADVTLYNTSAPASDSVAVGVGLRSVFALFNKAHPKREFKFTIGGQALISAQRQGTGYWAYAHGSGKMPKTKTRLTAGVSSGTRQLFGQTTRLHFIGAAEQPLSERVSIIADWFSGPHAQGVLTAGASFSLNKTTTVFAGCQRPNNKAAAGGKGLTFELSKIF